MILYWNFLLQREGLSYYRIRYNMLHILEKVGGLMSCITVAMFYIMKPCYYKKHDLAVLREYENKGLCRDINHNTICNQLPLDISPFRLFLYDLKNTLLSPCRRNDPDEEEEESSIDLMTKKMDRVKKDNMDIINIMKIDRIEQSLDVIRSKSGETKNTFKDKRKRKMSAAATCVSHNHNSLMVFGDSLDKGKKSNRIDLALFGDNKPLRKNKTMVMNKETELTNNVINI